MTFLINHLASVSQVIKDYNIFLKIQTRKKLQKRLERSVLVTVACQNLLYDKGCKNYDIDIVP